MSNGFGSGISGIRQVRYTNQANVRALEETLRGIDPENDPTSANEALLKASQIRQRIEDAADVADIIYQILRIPVN